MLVSRTFTMADQIRFATVSGDRNPMHLDAVSARRTQAADLTSKSDETLTLGFDGGRLKSAGRLQERGVNLRVVADGRMGFAGTTDTEPEPLLEMALAETRKERA